jgi:hypothetical protein
MVDKAVLGIVTLVAALLIVVIAFTFVSSKPSQSNTSTIPYTFQTTAPATTVPPITIVPASKANASVASLFISQAEAGSLLGQGGMYGVYSRSTSQQLESALPQQLLAYNISAEYSMNYTVNTTQDNGVMSEVIFRLNNPKALYSVILSQYPYFNGTALKQQGIDTLNYSVNSTYNGFVYSSSEFILPPSAIQGGTTNTSLAVVFGYTNTSVILLSLVRLNYSALFNTTRLVRFAVQNVT